MDILKFKRKPELSRRQEEMKKLQEELGRVNRMLKSCRSLYNLTVDDDLIEARIYQIKSLSKHYDYLFARIKKLRREISGQENTPAAGV